MGVDGPVRQTSLAPAVLQNRVNRVVDETGCGEDDNITVGK